MKNRYLLVSVLAIGALFSCQQKEQDLGEIDIDNVVFHAVNSDYTQTRTSLQADGSILWDAGDYIEIFFGDNKRTFRSLNEESAAEVDFSGDFSGVIWPAEPFDYWAVFPRRIAKNKNTFDGSSLGVYLSAEQIAYEGTFGHEQFISVAKSSDFTLNFYNVCGGIKFSVDRDNIVKVVFSGNNNEDLAGWAKVTFNNDGLPESEITEGEKTITFNARYEQTLEKGVWYYIVTYPAALENGFTMTFIDKDGFKAEKIISAPRTIKRAIWGRLENTDSSLDYVQPDNIILYTTSDEDIIQTSLKDSKGNSPTSNTYENGVGKLIYGAPLSELLTADAFKGETRLLSISLPGQIATIGENAFRGSGLRSISLPEKVSWIGKEAFAYCESLETVVLPEAVTTIKDGAFSYCSKLKNINIPSGVTAIPYKCFYRCSSLAGIEFPDGLLSILGLAFSESGLETVTFPAGLKGMGVSAFSFTKLEDINLPIGLSYVPESAFANCGRLTSVTVPDAVQTIGISAFAHCTSLTDVDLNKTTWIGKEAFRQCTSIHYIELPELITQIDDSAYYGCEGASTIRIKAATPPTLGTKVFYMTNECPIFVPRHSNVSTYKNATGWSDYASRIHAFSDEGSDFVDLGLSVLWGKHNLGATSEAEAGKYYAWGETTPKETFYENNYKWYDTSITPMKILKYNSDNSKGTVDNLLQLEGDDDAAYIINEYHHIPTAAEWQELIDNSVVNWSSRNNVPGIEIQSTVPGFSNRIIFIPAARSKREASFEAAEGVGMYWASTKLEDSSFIYKAQMVSFTADTFEVWKELRYCGLPIRPVAKQ